MIARRFLFAHDACFAAAPSARADELKPNDKALD
jgi:hypothetical protein